MEDLTFIIVKTQKRTKELLFSVFISLCFLYSFPCVFCFHSLVFSVFIPLCFQELLKLWIHHQYVADKDKERFLESIWTVAKVCRDTEQIGVLIDGVNREVKRSQISKHIQPLLVPKNIYLIANCGISKFYWTNSFLPIMS